MKRLCLICGIEIIRKKEWSYKQYTQIKYCSRNCLFLSRKGKPSSLKGKHFTAFEKNCLACGAIFFTTKYRISIGRGKYCSKECHITSQKGKHVSFKTEFKKGQFLNEKHPLWEGDEVSYSGLHYWIQRKLGQPSLCENCGTTKAKRFEWANISGEYKRDLNDWKRLCKSCHVFFDDIGKKAWITRRTKNA